MALRLRVLHRYILIPVLHLKIDTHQHPPLQIVVTFLLPPWTILSGLQSGQDWHGKFPQVSAVTCVPG